jgi:HK97 family phage major capsid protein
MDFEKLKEQLESWKKNIEKAVQDKIAEQSTAANSEVVALKAKLEEINASLKSLKDQEEARKQLAIPGLKDNLKTNPFSWSKFAFAALSSSRGNNKAWDNAGYELEIIENYKKLWVPTVYKDAIAGDGTQGGYLIPEEVTSEIIDMTIANMVIMQMGCTELRNLYGDLPIPKMTARNTGYWVGETEAPTESNVTFGEFTLRPKKAGVFTKYSKRLSYQTRGTADNLIKQMVSDSLALTLDAGFLSGTGTQSQPKGILTQTGMTTTANQATNGARFRVDKAAAMIQALDAANELRDGGNYGFIMRPEVLGGMRRERIPQFTGQPIGQGMPLSMTNVLMSNQQLEQQIGYKLRSTTQLSAAVTCGTSSTCSKVIFGNWKQMFLGFWRGMEIKVSDQASDASGNSSFLKDEFFMVAFQEVDSNVGRATAFTTVSDAETTESNWSNG